MNVASPQLWWPHDYGTPYRYTLVTKFVPSAGVGQTAQKTQVPSFACLWALDVRRACVRAIDARVLHRRSWLVCSNAKLLLPARAEIRFTILQCRRR